MTIIKWVLDWVFGGWWSKWLGGLVVIGSLVGGFAWDQRARGREMRLLKSTTVPRSNLKKPVGLVLVSLTAAMLSSCGATIVATVEPFCKAVKGVVITKDDILTEPTAKRIRQDIEGRKKIGCKDEPVRAWPPAKVKPAAKVS